MRELKMPRPNPRQELFFTARQKYVIFGGARGGGKSWAVRWKAVLLCGKYPGIRTLIMRRSFPEPRFSAHSSTERSMEPIAPET